MSWAGVEVWKTPRCLPSPSSEPSNMVLYASAPPSPCREEYRIYSSQELNKTPARTLPVGDIALHPDPGSDYTPLLLLEEPLSLLGPGTTSAAGPAIIQGQAEPWSGQSEPCITLATSD